jgi:hypothetical protein
MSDKIIEEIEAEIKRPRATLMILKLKSQKTPQMKIRQKIDLPQQRKAKIMGLKFKSAFKSLSASVEMLKSKLAKFKSKIFSFRKDLSALSKAPSNTPKKTSTPDTSKPKRPSIKPLKKATPKLK